MTTAGPFAGREPWRTLLGDHPTTRALRQGRVTPPIVNLVTDVIASLP